MQALSSPVGRDVLRPYVYGPLLAHRIRVLKLLPARLDQEAVFCQIGERADQLSDVDNGYEALSWCWGDGRRDMDITIYENDEVYFFPVSAHLYEAIKALRYVNRVRFLWIDAICINQDDVMERNQQVAKMDEVYGNATNVCVWLGASTETTTAALEFVRLYFNFDSFEGFYENPKYIRSWIAVLNLMKRPWFRRRWVVQEISLARKVSVYCGRDLVAWEAFCVVAVDFETSAEQLSALINKDKDYGYVNDFFEEVSALEAIRLVKITNRFRRSASGLMHCPSSLEDLVMELLTFESSEPRDTVYALLALAKDCNRSAEIIPTYIEGKRLTEKQRRALSLASSLLPTPYRQRYIVNYDQHVVDVYQQFIAFAISKRDPSRALDVLCRPFAHLPRNSDGKESDTLPSWIAGRSGAPFDKHKVRGLQDGEERFLMERQRGNIFVSTPSSTTHYHAAGSKVYDKTKLRFRKRRDHHSLLIDGGFVLDTITEVEQVSQLGNIPAGWLQQRRKFNDIDPNIFWRALVADRGPTGDPAPLYYRNAIDAALNQASDETAFDVKRHIHNATSKIAAEALRQVQETIWERCLIVTKRGFLGLAPRTTQRGDVVCILDGCSVPIVMRRIKKTEKEIGMEVEDDLRTQLPQVKKFAKRAIRHLRERLEANSSESLNRRAAISRDDDMSQFQEHSTPDSSRRDPSLGRNSHPIFIVLRIAMKPILLVAIICALYFGMHDHMAAIMLVELALPHAIADTCSVALQQALGHQQQLSPLLTTLVLATIILSLYSSTTSFWTMLLYSIAILVVFEVSFLETLRFSIGRQCREIVLLIRNKTHSEGRISSAIQTPPIKLTQSPSKASKPPSDDVQTTSQEPNTRFEGPISPDDLGSYTLLGIDPLPHYHRVVGESYIDGMMYGEAIQLQNESTFPATDGGQLKRILPETFELR